MNIDCRVFCNLLLVICLLGGGEGSVLSLFGDPDGSRVLTSTNGSSLFATAPLSSLTHTSITAYPAIPSPTSGDIGVVCLDWRRRNLYAQTGGKLTRAPFMTSVLVFTKTVDWIGPQLFGLHCDVHQSAAGSLLGIRVDENYGAHIISVDLCSDSWDQKALMSLPNSAKLIPGVSAFDAHRRMLYLPTTTDLFVIDVATALYTMVPIKLGGSCARTITSLEVDPIRGTLYGIREKNDGSTTLVVLHVATGSMLPIAELPAKTVHGVSTFDFHAGMYYFRLQGSPATMSIDIVTHEIRDLGDWRPSAVHHRLLLDPCEACPVSCQANYTCSSSSVNTSCAIAPSIDAATQSVWWVATISETTQVAGAVNRLSFVLRPKVLFAIGDVIELTGLVGTSITNTTTLPLTGTSSTQLGSVGVWTQPDGRLVLTLTSVMPTTVDSMISIDLSNPLIYQTPRIPSIATQGSVPSQPVPMYGSALGGTCVQMCDNATMAAVGMQTGSITDAQITATTTLDDTTKPGYARLNSQRSGWSPAIERQQYLEVDFGRWIQLLAIATQGHGMGVDSWVTEFMLQTSSDGVTYENTTFLNGTTVMFGGNVDRDTVVMNTLPVCIPSIRWLRIRPSAWFGAPVLRFEAYGAPTTCTGTAAVSVTESTRVPGVVNNITISLRPMITLHPGTLVTFHGMVGANTSDTVLPVMDSTASRAWATNGVWTQSSGSLRLNVTNLMSANIDFTFQFQLSNPLVPQISRAITVSASSHRLTLIAATSLTHVLSSSASCNETCADTTTFQLANVSQFQASSFTTGMEPHFARLGNDTSAWCPATASTADWLQVDLRQRAQLHKIATQGRVAGAAQQWTTAFELDWSPDGMTWYQYLSPNGLPHLFQGNVDMNTVVENSLPRCVSPVQALRFKPKSSNTWPCLRVELYTHDLTCT